MGESKNLFEFLMGEENVNQLYILILLVVLDYITGICVAVHQKQLSSKIGFKGISLKVMICVMYLMGIFSVRDRQSKQCRFSSIAQMRL